MPNSPKKTAVLEKSAGRRLSAKADGAKVEKSSKTKISTVRKVVHTKSKPEVAKPMVEPAQRGEALLEQVSPPEMKTEPATEEVRQPLAGKPAAGIEELVTPVEPLETVPPSEPPAPAPAKAGKGSTANGDHIIHLKPPIIVRDLAVRMAVKPFQLISDLMQLKILVSINQPVEPEIARKLCEKHGFKLELERRGEHAVKPAEVPKEESPERGIAREPPKKENLVSRPPVVTIMGHVDHGKTSLLDAIRKTNIVADEAGGITQHIGAYSVSISPQGNGNKNTPARTVTFLDTPGHEAFTAMRARGANITDVVILVIAASEGLMPQTIEAINHARAASVPIIVALTKMDLEAAQKMKDRVKKQLQEHDLAPEEWGGKTITVEVSATKKTGIDQLLEMILLQAEVMELKAEQDCLADGSVIEAQMEAGRGPTATVLIRRGILHVGDSGIVGPYWCKIKALVDDKGRAVKQAGPSMPVKIVGLSRVPVAGAHFLVMKSEAEARAYSDREQEKLRAKKLESPKRLTLADLLSNTGDNRKVLKIILKTDVHGSCEAIIQSVEKLPQDKINVDIIHTAVGPITESDVLLAVASKALIVGFHVKVDNAAAEAARLDNVQIQLFRIIYELIDKLREVMAGLLEPEVKLSSLGMAEVKQVFSISKGGAVAGCVVTQGRIERKGRVRILRRKSVIFEGGISTLRRFQDDVSDVRTGLECGVRLDGFDDYQPGDIIEVYHIEKVAQKL